MIRNILIAAFLVTLAFISQAHAYTYAAVQASQYLWVIQRSDGYYLESDANGNKMWSVTQTPRYFGQNTAGILAYLLSNPPTSDPWTYSSATYSGPVYGIGAQYCTGTTWRICTNLGAVIPKDPPDNGNWTWPPMWYSEMPGNGVAWTLNEVPSQFALWAFQNKNAAGQ